MTKLPPLHSTDAALLHGAAANDAAVVTHDPAVNAAAMLEVTPERWAEICAALREREAHDKTALPELVAACPPDMRIAVLAWALEQMTAHAKEGGSFRHLIYNRMGFRDYAYVPLWKAGGELICAMRLGEQPVPVPIEVSGPFKELIEVCERLEQNRLAEFGPALRQAQAAFMHDAIRRATAEHKKETKA